MHTVLYILKYQKDAFTTVDIFSNLLQLQLSILITKSQTKLCLFSFSVVKLTKIGEKPHVTPFIMTVMEKM